MPSPCLLQLAAVETVAGAMPDPGEGWLTEAESARLLAITAPARALQFLAGHWLVRQLAAQRAGGDPADWRLEARGGGKPRLWRAGHAGEMHGSLSHSGAWIAAAVAEAPVGVDLEIPQKARDLKALAAFVFSPDECAHLDTLDGEAHLEAFYALWTLKEARGKRSGDGLQPAQARTVTAAACTAGEAEALRWSLPGRGSLAFAAWPGARVEFPGAGVDRDPSYWRYLHAP